VGNACVVDEIVEPAGTEIAQRLLHAVDEIAECADFPCIELQGDGLGTLLTFERQDLLGLGAIGVVCEDRMDAAPGQAQHGIPAKTATSAGDDSDGGRIRNFSRVRLDGTARLFINSPFRGPCGSSFLDRPGYISPRRWNRSRYVGVDELSAWRRRSGSPVGYGVGPLSPASTSPFDFNFNGNARCGRFG
jgi:hypothetical protein